MARRPLVAARRATSCWVPMSDLGDALDAGHEVLRLQFLRGERERVREAFVRLARRRRRRDPGGHRGALGGDAGWPGSAALRHPEFDVVGSGADLPAAASMRPDVVLAACRSRTRGRGRTQRGPGCPAGERRRSGVDRGGAAARRAGGAAAGCGGRGIVAAVQAAAAGLVALDPRDLEVLLAGAAHAHPPPETAALTARELEVLRMMAEGAANKNIAWKLGISEHTVKFHVASILGKLNAASRTEAVTTGIRKGLILI